MLTFYFYKLKTKTELNKTQAHTHKQTKAFKQYKLLSCNCCYDLDPILACSFPTSLYRNAGAPKTGGETRRGAANVSNNGAVVAAPATMPSF